MNGMGVMDEFCWRRQVVGLLVHWLGQVAAARERDAEMEELEAALSLATPDEGELDIPGVDGIPGLLDALRRCGDLTEQESQRLVRKVLKTWRKGGQRHASGDGEIP